MRYDKLITQSDTDLTQQGPKKVAFVLPLLTAGGAERVLISLMNGLDRKRFSPEFIVLNEDGPMRDWIAGDVPFHSLGNRRVRESLLPLLTEIRRVKPDIIVSTMAHMNFALLMLRPFLTKEKIIVREANIPSSIVENVRTGKPWMVKAAYRSLYPMADMVISPAQVIINEFENYLGMNTKDHALLYNPVDVERIRAKTKLPKRKNEDTINFIAAGRLHRQKGFDRLIESLPRLKTGRDWTLTILGEGEEMDNLQTLVRANGLQDKIKLPGLSRDPWPQIASADCFLLPSRWEGLPNVVLESLACGTPVIAAHEAGGIGEIASLAYPGTVTVADDMENFIGAMRMIRPYPAKKMRPPLLPPQYEMDNVITRFSDLLDGKVEEYTTPQRRLFGRKKAA